ncbi:MAG: hypothetical protein FWD12_15995 [Alphaproteobacteria bacterium]|nr:hypothetical protein [Alphaproteobacteria bacterium]
MPSSHHDSAHPETVHPATGPVRPEAPSLAPDPSGDVVEYVVRPENDSWRIEHAGGSYGPYSSRREATFFAIDAARKLAAAGKNTRVKAIDQAGHLLTTWQHPAPGR